MAAILRRVVRLAYPRNGNVSTGGTPEYSYDVYQDGKLIDRFHRFSEAKKFAASIAHSPGKEAN